MTVHVSVRSMSALLLLCVSRLRLPAGAPAKAVVAPQKAAGVGLLPDSNLGFVVLTNTFSALPSIATQLVPQHLLGELPPAASDVGDLKPYLGRYVANFRTFSNDVFTIFQRNSRLVLDIPSQYVGRYRDEAGATEPTIRIQNQRLAVRLPNGRLFDFLPPDATRRRATRANVGLAVTIDESPTGAVSAMNFQRPDAPVMRLTPVASTLPTVTEIMTLRRIPAASASATMRTTGSVRLPQSAVEGRFSSSTAGDDRLQTALDLDGSVQIRTVLNKGRASAAVSGAPPRELTGKQLAQTRLGHPSVLFGDRRTFQADRVEVGVALPPGTFTLQPSTESYRKQ